MVVGIDAKVAEIELEGGNDWTHSSKSRRLSKLEWRVSIRLGKGQRTFLASRKYFGQEEDLRRNQEKWEGIGRGKPGVSKSAVDEK